LGFSATDWVLLSNLGYSLQILFVLAVAYAVVKHRVIDVRFFLSRTIVFSLLTVFLVLVLRTIDWFLTVIIAGERFAVLLEFAAAVGLGLILHGLQTRLEHFTSRWLFRSRYLAGQRLRRVSAGLAHAESMEPVCEMVVNEPAEALNLASCALFLRDESGSFARRASFGWEGVRLCRISPDDATMLELIGSFEPLRLRDVHDDLFDGFDADRKTVLALAIHAGGRLRGALFAGAHASGEELDRTEVALLADVAAAAGHAFDHVEAAALRRRVDELEEALRRASPQPNA
jgi:GAF domain-containing protein